MPAAVASRARDLGRSAQSSRDARPPAKKTKLAQPPAAPRQNGLKALLNGAADKRPAVAAEIKSVRKKDAVDDATAVVSGGQAGHGDVDMEATGKEVIEISSGEEESDYSSSEVEEQAGADAGAPEVIGAAPIINGHIDGEEQPIEDGTAEPEDLSFESRLRAQEPEPEPEPARAPHVVDVESAFVGPDADSRALATSAINQPLAAPSATSLGTVLTQALRTNDQELLDSCLRVNDVDTVYATIERLPSPLIGTLLHKLAERLHKRPGRPGMLMVWVQWSLSAHGGYLATQTHLVTQLATLNKVLKERASGLQPLLSLKGRLDMLHAQLELRRRNQRRAAHDDMDEAVIYVEGEEEPSSAEEDEESDGASHSPMGDSRKRIRSGFDDVDESSVDEMPTTMEVDEESEEGSEDSEDLLDDEAEETENDTGDEMSEPMSDDLEDGEDISESEEESMPARRSTTGRAGLARRY
ncbi:NUC189-domain-containing protein [Trematosphaeria pertusa]|uniref:NUC189-domain-containing protein n=1 Tax=Trematosphaeria pertusa TaxID=390896 RepID=A0A6A6J2T5_9PLEO|nr:NUC189-domain-containing protein [Trematosphaeria pertusa]KAF2256878.1 NUC189-domain-containing protein [Trematosphaeria pertusa]